MVYPYYPWTFFAGSPLSSIAGLESIDLAAGEHLVTVGFGVPEIWKTLTIIHELCYFASV
jgi:hypothetical protein